MVYKPQLDRQGFADRQRINQDRNRPTMSRKDAFLQGESDAGRNYATMMDLMKQAERTGGFKSGDPRTDQLKDARRQYNRQDKYNIGEIMGQTPQFMNELYRTNSGVLREYANPTYNAMYPISEMLHRTTGSGGITGMLLNKAFGKTKEAGRGFYQDLRDMGGDILEAVGIGGALDPEEATEEVLENYANQTFGHPDMSEIAGPREKKIDFFAPESPTREEQLQSLIDEQQSKIDNFETGAYSDILDDAIENQWPSTKYEDYIERGSDLYNQVFGEVPEERVKTVPFDTGREAGIMQNMSPYSRNYVPPLKFPPRGPHDPFNPDQNMFENREEYDAWLRRKRLGY